MLPSVIGGHDAALRLGIFRSMNQLVSWNRRRFPLGHGTFANDTFCKTTGDLATLRKRHGIQCATMGTKEGTSRRDFPCQRHGTPPFVQSNCTPRQRVRSRTKPHPARACCRASSAGRVGAWGSWLRNLRSLPRQAQLNHVRVAGGPRACDVLSWRSTSSGRGPSGLGAPSQKCESTRELTVFHWFAVGS